MADPILFCLHGYKKVTQGHLMKNDKHLISVKCFIITFTLISPLAKMSQCA